MSDATRPTAGRRGRRARAAERPAAPFVQPRRRIASYPVASPEQIDEIHRRSLQILQDVGIAFYDDRAVARLREHGVDVDDEMVARFDPELVMEYVHKAPSEFVWRARNPERPGTCRTDCKPHWR